MSQRNNLNVHLIAERFWLGVVVVSTLITLWWWYNDELADREFAPFLPAIALVWYLFRRYLRKRIEKNSDDSA